MRFTFTRTSTVIAAALLAACDSQTFTRLSPPLLVVNTDAVAFGAIPVGSTVSRRVTLANGGQTALAIRELRLEGSSTFSLRGASSTIAAGSEIEVTISFAPPSIADFRGTLIIDSDASNSAHKALPVTGAGVSATSCQVCDMPPPPTCVSDDDLLSYAHTGTCVMGQCQYTASVEACAQGCDRSQQACRGGGPADAGVPVDAGASDTGMVDTGAADAGMADTGAPDAGAADAGAADTGAADAGAADAGQQVLTTPGEHRFVVPSGITELLVRAWGGGGEGGNQSGATGGGAGFIQGRVPVTPGEALDVWVAEGGGYNRPGHGDGGGASYLRRGALDLLIAGGGGGGGSDGNSGNSMAGGSGGAGGGLQGQAGQSGVGSIAAYCTSVTGGTGATQAAGGMGGTFGGSAPGCNGQNGARDIGGRATGTNSNCDSTPGAYQWRSGGGQGNGGGGGGGAGYYGGGGAGFIWTYCAGGGGGGSSYADASVLGVVHQAGSANLAGLEAEAFGAGRGGDRCQLSSGACPGSQGGNGRVEISY